MPVIAPRHEVAEVSDSEHTPGATFRVARNGMEWEPIASAGRPGRLQSGVSTGTLRPYFVRGVAPRTAAPEFTVAPLGRAGYPSLLQAIETMARDPANATSILQSHRLTYC